MIMSELHDKWLSLVKDWETSGLTQAEFCRQHDIKKVTFGNWRSKFIASGDVESRATKSTSLDSDAPAGFIPFNISSSDHKIDLSTGIIEISLPHGINLRIPVDAHAK